MWYMIVNQYVMNTVHFFNAQYCIAIIGPYD